MGRRLDTAALPEEYAYMQRITKGHKMSIYEVNWKVSLHWEKNCFTAVEAKSIGLDVETDQGPVDSPKWVRVVFGPHHFVDIYPNDELPPLNGI